MADMVDCISNSKLYKTQGSSQHVTKIYKKYVIFVLFSALRIYFESGVLIFESGSSSGCLQYSISTVSDHFVTISVFNVFPCFSFFFLEFATVPEFFTSPVFLNIHVFLILKVFWNFRLRRIFDMSPYCWIWTFFQISGTTFGHHLRGPPSGTTFGDQGVLRTTTK